MPVQSLKETVYRSENIHQQKLKADETKNEATILALWLRGKNKSTFLILIEGKQAEGYQISMLPLWALSANMGNKLGESTEPQKASGWRPWRRIWTKGMVNTEGKKWLLI